LIDKRTCIQKKLKGKVQKTDIVQLKFIYIGNAFASKLSVITM